MAATKKAPAKKAAKAVEPVEIPVKPIRPGDVKLDDMMHQNWACMAPSGYTQEMLEQSKLWTFMAPKFKDLDHIRITAEDGSYVAWGIIRRTISMEVTVQIYDMVELQEQQMAEEIKINQYVIRHFGPVRKFAVVNTDNGQTVKEGFQSQTEALKYVTSQIQATQKVAQQAQANTA